MINFDIIKLSKKLPAAVRLTTLSRALDIAIPFNFGLGIKIKSLTQNEAVLVSKDIRKRRNHVGSAHACFLALLSEYPAGLLLAEHYPFDKYRIIIADLKMKYEKQGRGTLTSTARAPQNWPPATDGETYVDLETEIVNEKGERVSLCQTRWQIKEWAKVRKK